MTNNKASKKRLGRGMEALFYEETISENEMVEEIVLDDIRSNPYQPRKHFDENALQELADSIKQSGVFQPVILRKSMIKGYELIAGERRVRASKIAGKTTIPAIVRQVDENVMIEIAVIENLQREDLSPLEEAEAYEMLMDKLQLTQAEVADRIGKSRPYIANYLRLLSLPESIKQLVTTEQLSMGQARTLLGLKNKDLMVSIAQKVVQEQLTVRQLEELVQQYNEPTKETKKPATVSPIEKPQNIIACENRMQELFGTNAVITQKGNQGKGKIEIDFMSESDLIRILDLLDIQL